MPGEPAHFYFGSVNGGVWETRNAGRTWEPIFDGQPIGSIGALGVAPSAPKVLYVGTGEADMRSDISQGDGMYRSTDGGTTWTLVSAGIPADQAINVVREDPVRRGLLYAAEGQRRDELTQLADEIGTLAGIDPTSPTGARWLTPTRSPVFAGSTAPSTASTTRSTTPTPPEPRRPRQPRRPRADGPPALAAWEAVDRKLATSKWLRGARGG